MAEQTANHLDVGAVPPPSLWLRVWDSDVFYSFRSSKVAMVAALAIGGASTTQAKVGFGKPGEKGDLVIGYQPYYTESWSGVVINGQNLWKKHCLLDLLQNSRSVCKALLSSESF